MASIPPNDEMLMAYADGELDAAASEELEYQAGHDPVIARRVVEFLRSRRLARTAMALRPRVGATASGRIPAFVLSQAVPAGRAVTARRLLASWGVFVLGLVALAAGVGFFNAGPGTSAASALELGDAQRALDSLPAGGVVVASGIKFKAIGTYRLADGQLCREVIVELEEETGDTVACRRNGVWSIRIVVVNSSPDEAVPAIDDNRPVDEYLRIIQAGDALSPEEEKAALADS